MNPLTETIHLTKGMYSVHNKHNPGDTNPLNYTYVLSGVIYSTVDDKLYRRYLPLYLVQDEAIQELDEEFDGFIRSEDEFLSPAKPWADIPRFKFFRTREELDSFIIEAKNVLMMGYMCGNF